MPQKSEVFSANKYIDLQTTGRPEASAPRSHQLRDCIEIAVVFTLILVAVWTPQGHLNSFVSISAAACVVAFAVMGRWSVEELGLTRPFSGAISILLTGAMLCGAIALMGMAFRMEGASYSVPLGRSWEYVVWSLAQEFILQSIFFVRLESLLGSWRAMFAAAGLFSIAHIPSVVLVPLSFCGGIIFCYLFRRWRNLYLLGVIHGALGLTVAASMPEHWLHHMRVGIGYLRLHA